MTTSPSGNSTVPGATGGQPAPPPRPQSPAMRLAAATRTVISAGPQELLAIYLNDHLAGAVAGSELARRCARNNLGTRYANELRQIADAIAEDRRSLEQLMAALGVTPNPVKNVSALVAERLARLKLNGRLTGYSPLSRIIEFDGLSAGINGKRVLWLTLLHLADTYPAIDADEMRRLIDRADQQLETVQQLRDDATREAFVTS